MTRYEIFFTRRISRIIIAEGFYEKDNTIMFYNNDNDVIFAVSVYNFDYIEVK